LHECHLEVIVPLHNYDFRGFSVDEDVCKTQKNMDLMKKIGFHGVDLDDVVELLTLSGRPCLEKSPQPGRQGEFKSPQSH
jgi:hypothetical protein